MPNQVHGIIILNELPIVETPYTASLQNKKQRALGDVVGKYKAAVNRQSRKFDFASFQWQT